MVLKKMGHTINTVIHMVETEIAYNTIPDDYNLDHMKKKANMQLRSRPSQ